MPPFASAAAGSSNKAMDTLIGSTIGGLQRESACWRWVGLLTEAGMVQLLIRTRDIAAHGDLPPAARIKVRGDWLRPRNGDKPWFFVVNGLEIVGPQADCLEGGQ